jgi:hypothetical protein
MHFAFKSEDIDFFLTLALLFSRFVSFSPYSQLNGIAQKRAFTTHQFHRKDEGPSAVNVELPIFLRIQLRTAFYKRRQSRRSPFSILVFDQDSITVFHPPVR